jgi:hypothetical protein
MKIYILIACTFFQLFTFSERVYAGGGLTGGSTEITQILNNGELLLIDAADAVTSVSTAASQIDSIIFRPLQTMLITIAQQQAADDILSWVNGGTQGNSLVISNPEKYMKNQGLGVVKQALNDIPSDSVFGDSIFSSLTSEYRDIDLGTQLANLSSSDEASIIQDSMCDDGTLTELAINAIADDNGNYSNADLTAEKTKLYNYACAGDPKKDPEVATRLADLGKQNASIGGWDRWLCTTGGNCNQYTQVTKARNVVAEKEKARQEFISKEIFLGAGPVSQTNCLEYAPTANEDEEPVCIEYETLTPGKTVANSLNSAANSGLDRLTNLMEGGLTGLLTSLAISKLTGGVNAAIKASQSGSNTGSTVTTKAAPKQDLAGDPSTKKSVTNPMTKMLDSNDETLTKVQNVDQEYLGEVTKYANDIDAGRACYDALVDSGLKQVPPVDLRNDPKVIEAYAFYDDRQSKIEAAREKINAELQKIDQGKILIDATKVKIANSNSTQEMSTIYDEFSNAYDDAKYPNMQTLGTRQGEINKGEAEIKDDKDNIDKYKNTCTQMGGNGGGTQDPGGA